MAGWAGGRSIRPGVRHAVAVAGATGLAAYVLIAWSPAAIAAAASAPGAPQTQAATGLGHLGVHRLSVTDQTAQAASPAGVSWPAAGSGEATLVPATVTPAVGAVSSLSRALSGAGGPVGVTGTPLWAEWAGGASGAARSVSLRVLPHSAATAAGVNGVVFTAAASGSAGPIRVGLNYAGFADVYGGNYGLSLGLVQLPACALTTPNIAKCREQTPLQSVNDAAGASVSAQLTLPVTTSAGTSTGGAATAAAAPTMTGSAPVVLAAAPVATDGGGPAGTYSATTLKASGTWTAGNSDGSFQYSYPISVPPAASGLAPAVSLSYDSGSIDGQTAATQAQASWAGDGWQTQQSFVEQ